MVVVMTKPQIGIMVCLSALLGPTPGVAAQTFGTLYAGPQAFAPGGLMAQPEIAQWLMRLPQEEAPSGPAANELAMSADILAPYPIGGELFRLALIQPDDPAKLGRAVSDLLFDASATGGPPQRFADVPAPQAVAENIGQDRRAASEGRSVSMHRIRTHAAPAARRTRLPVAFRKQHDHCWCAAVR